MHKEMSVDADEVMADLGDSRSQAESVEGTGMPNILSGILQHFVLALFAFYKCSYMVYNLNCNISIFTLG
jgi:hypothetical protein